ncbi:MAG: hypothetical protein ACPL4K_06405, partial [Candidatus Margulisiibacteriota bacterium]
RRAIYLSAALGKTNAHFGYIARSTGENGLIAISEVNFKVSHHFPSLDLTLNPRYFYHQSGRHDLRLELSSQFYLNKLFDVYLLLGMAKTADFPRGLYGKWELTIGQEVKIMAQKIGAQYREFFSYSIFDIFNRNLSDGQENLGVELRKNLGEKWLVKAKADYTNPAERQTAELRLGYLLAASSALEMIYQFYKNVDPSWALGVGWWVRF